jgi:hypothetical protein
MKNATLRIKALSITLGAYAECRDAECCGVILKYT